MNSTKNRIVRFVTLVMVVVGVFSLGAPATPVSAQGAWYGEYFANSSLSGGPSFTRYDDRLDFSWGNGSPGAGIPSDGFSVRWTRDEWFETGTYRFSYRSDDGVRIWVGDTLVVDDWRDRQAAWSSVDRFISRGTYRVRVEYFEHTGGAIFQAGWERVSGGSGWRGEYFSNRDLSGSPVLVRYDAAVDFDWKTDSPAAGVPADNFSVRWSYTLGFTAGTYRFNSSTDDGVRVYVDGTRIIDGWSDGRLPNTRSGDITLSDGQHTVIVEYFEHGGNASAHVWWNRLGTFGAWQGRYYDNAELRGGPALIRDDADINFDWGEGAPAAWMPADNFSIVWTRQINFTPGYYRLNVRADDGVRVWLDNALIMDYWSVQNYDWHYVDGTYLTGLHTLKVEYFERAGLARIRFWSEPSAVQPAPSGPAPTPAPAPVPGTLGPWQGEYFKNTSLTGSPALVRSDAALNFNWGLGAPAAGFGADNFSVRWSGNFHFVAGRYTFTTYSDDGVRLYVDGQLVINSWQGMRGYRSGSVNLTAGAHDVRLEYFERTGAAVLRLSWTGSETTPSPVAPLPSPSQPTACAGGPLTLTAWAVSSSCSAGGWVATIFVQAKGGDCQYTYAWEGQVKGGPTSSSMTFDVKSANPAAAIVGTASVTSAGQTARAGVYVKHPACQ
jgi:hypothetical protein